MQVLAANSGEELDDGVSHYDEGDGDVNDQMTGDHDLRSNNSNLVTKIRHQQTVK